MAFDIKRYYRDNRDYYGNASLDEVAKDVFLQDGYDREFSSFDEFKDKAGIRGVIEEDIYQRSAEKARQDTPGYLGELGRSIGRGLTQTAPQMAGRGLQWLDPDGGIDLMERAGKSLEEFGDKNVKRFPGLTMSKEAEEAPWYSPRMWMGHAGESLVQSLAPFAAGAAGMVAGGPIAGAAAGLATLGTMFYGGTAEETYRKAKENGLADDEARDLANITGGVEAGGELVADLIPIKLFGGLGQAAKGSIIKTLTSRQPVKKMLQDVMKTVAGEEITESAQQAIQTYAENKYGTSDQGVLESVAEVWGPTLITSLVFGAGGVGYDINHRRQLRNALTNPDADPDTRLQAIQEVAGAAEKIDPGAGKNFFNHAIDLWKQAKPITLDDDDFYAPPAPKPQAPPAGPITAALRNAGIQPVPASAATGTPAAAAAPTSGTGRQAPTRTTKPGLVDWFEAEQMKDEERRQSEAFEDTVNVHSAMKDWLPLVHRTQELQEAHGGLEREAEPTTPVFERQMWQNRENNRQRIQEIEDLNDWVDHLKKTIGGIEYAKDSTEAVRKFDELAKGFGDYEKSKKQVEDEEFSNWQKKSGKSYSGYKEPEPPLSKPATAKEMEDSEFSAWAKKARSEVYNDLDEIAELHQEMKGVKSEKAKAVLLDEIEQKQQDVRKKLNLDEYEYERMERSKGEPRGARGLPVPPKPREDLGRATAEDIAGISQPWFVRALRDITDQQAKMKKAEKIPNRGGLRSMESWKGGVDNAKGKEAETVLKPDFEKMVIDASSWKGATMQAAQRLGSDKKKALELSRKTTKGDLDAYLMRKFGVDETTAREVSNELTRRNMAADMTANIDDFSEEPWFGLLKEDNVTPDKEQKASSNIPKTWKEQFDAMTAAGLKIGDVVSNGGRTGKIFRGVGGTAMVRMDNPKENEPRNVRWEPGWDKAGVKAEKDGGKNDKGYVYIGVNTNGEKLYEDPKTGRRFKDYGSGRLSGEPVPISITRGGVQAHPGGRNRRDDIIWQTKEEYEAETQTPFQDQESLNEEIRNRTVEKIKPFLNSDQTDDATLASLKSFAKESLGEITTSLVSSGQQIPKQVLDAINGFDSNKQAKAILEHLKATGQLGKKEETKEESDSAEGEDAAYLEEMKANLAELEEAEKNSVIGDDRRMKKIRDYKKIIKEAEDKITPVPPEQDKKEQEPSNYGKTNKIFTEEMAAKAREVLRKKLNQLSSGFDPEIAYNGMILAGYHIEAGARKFVDYARKMIEDLGDSVKPYLKSFYLSAKAAPGIDNTGMNTEEEIDAIEKEMNADADTAVTGREREGAQGADQTGTDGESSDDVPGTETGRKTEPVHKGSRKGNDGDLLRGMEHDHVLGGGEKKSGPDATASADGAKTSDSVGRSPGDVSGVPARTESKRPKLQDHVIPEGGITRKGGWKTSAKANLDAIELLKKIQSENRPATPEEQETLSKYVGWGASELANNMFPGFARFGEVLPSWQSDQKWRELVERMGSLLTPEEISAAARSTKNAHYTSEKVVRSIYKILDRFGFKGGKILEPGVGVGNFVGLLPKEFRGKTVYTGIERDPISAGIASLLYPNQNIISNDFTKQALPREFFDAAIGNPPFGTTTIISDPEYRKFGFKLHNYFFAKSIDRVRPGGLLVFVTSRYTMDSKGDKTRQYLSERADLIGAIRLPQTAFKENAGTDVVTDILFLKKRIPDEPPAGEKWEGLAEVKAGDGTAQINEYYAEHPEMVLGMNSLEGSMYAKDSYTVLPLDGDIESHFEAAAKKLPENIYTQRTKNSLKEKRLVVERDMNPLNKKEGGLYVSENGELLIVDQGSGVPAETVKRLGPKDKEWLKGYVKLRDALKQSHYAQLTDDPGWEDKLKGLQKAYREFKKKFGNILSFRWKNRSEKDEDGNLQTIQYRSGVYDKLLRADVEGSLVSTLEEITEDGKIVESKVLTSRTLRAPSPPDIKNIHDALAVSLNENGFLDIDHVASLINMPREEAIETLGDLIFQNPSTNEFEMSDDYLSGNVVKKLEEAVQAAVLDERFKRNVEALEKVQPKPLPAERVSVTLGSGWIPVKYYNEFATEVLGLRDAEITHHSATNIWIVSGAFQEQGLRGAASEWSHADRGANEILKSVLNNNTPIKITRTVEENNVKKTVTDNVATEAVNDIVSKMRDRFQTWVWEDGDRATDLLEIYNKRFNNTAPRRFNGSHLTLPGVSLNINLYEHQKDAIWRIIQTGNTYLAHSVGAGKTMIMIAAGMEMKRLGMIQKPIYVVPKHMLSQFAREFYELYPAASVMVADEENFHTENRRRFVAQATLNAPDAIVMTHSSFQLLKMKEENIAPVRNQFLQMLRDSLEELQDDDSPRWLLKRVESRIEQAEQRFNSMIAEGDQNVFFEEMGCDFLFFDEAHEFRKLDYVTNMQAKGISPLGSKGAMGLHIKTMWLEKQNPGRSHVFASGTPITNTMGELYTVQRFFDPDGLIEDGHETFDAWASHYGEMRTEFEPNAIGRPEPVTRFINFVNIHALSSRVRKFMDILTSTQLRARLNVPKVKGGGSELVVCPAVPEMSEWLRTELTPRLEASKNWKPTRNERSNPDPVMNINADGKLAAIDMRFIKRDAPNNPDSKLNKFIDSIIEVYNETKDMVFNDPATGKESPSKGGAQICFYNVGFGKQITESRGFDARQWVMKRLKEAGIPSSDVAWMADYAKRDANQKEAMFKEVRQGKRRILIGSAKQMGTGMNVQSRLTHLLYLDAPWYPSDVEQPEGRIIRQGNQNQEVVIKWFATKGSYDSNMWNLVSRKSKMIESFFSGDADVDKIQDISEISQYEMAAAMTAGDDRAIRLVRLNSEIDKLSRLEVNHLDNKRRFARTIREKEAIVRSLESQLPKMEEAGKATEGVWAFDGGTVDGKKFGANDKSDFGRAVLMKHKRINWDQNENKIFPIGEYIGNNGKVFNLVAEKPSRDTSLYELKVRLTNEYSATVLSYPLGVDPYVHSSEVGWQKITTGQIVPIVPWLDTFVFGKVGAGGIVYYVAELRSGKILGASDVKGTTKEAIEAAKEAIEKSGKTKILEKVESDVEANGNNPSIDALENMAPRLSYKTTTAISNVSNLFESTKRSITEHKEEIEKLDKRIRAPFEYARQLAEKKKELHELQRELTETGENQVQVEGLEGLIETNEGEKTSDNPIQYSSVKANPKGLPVDQVRKHLAPIIKNAGAVVTVFDGYDDPAVAEFSKALKLHEETRNRIVRGFQYQNKVYINAAAFDKLEAAQSVLLHELVGHYGLLQFMGDDANQFFAMLGRHTKYRPGVLETGKRRGIDTTTEKGIQKAASEWFAEQIEKGSVEPNLWTRFLKALRNTLRRMGFTLEFSDAELAEVVRGAYEEAFNQDGVSTAKRKAHLLPRLEARGGEPSTENISFSVIQNIRNTEDPVNLILVNGINADIHFSTADLQSTAKPYIKWKQNKPDLNQADLALSNPLYSFQKVPQLKEAFEAATEAVDIKFLNQRQLMYSPDGKIAYPREIERFAKDHPEEYAKLGKEWIRDHDIWQYGYRVTGFAGDQWELVPPKRSGWKTGEFKTEAEAWKAAIEYEAEAYLRENKWATEDGARALRMLRTMGHNMFNMLHADIQALIDDYKAENRELPTVAYYDKDGERIEIDLQQALVRMGDLRGSYFPRIRKPGRYVLRAQKQGEHPIREHFDLALEFKNEKDWKSKIPLPINKRARELKKQGYTVTLDRADSLPESVFVELSGQSVAMESLLSKALNEMGEKSPRSLDDLGIKGKWRGDDYVISGSIPRDYQGALGNLGGEYHYVTTRKGGFPEIVFRKAQKGAIEQEVENEILKHEHIKVNADVLFAEAMVNQVADIFKSRGARSRMIKRQDAVGEDVVLGYEEDLAVAFTTAAQGVAGANAKGQLARKLHGIITGKTESWEEFKVRRQIEDMGQTPSYKEYLDEATERKIDPAKQPSAYKAIMSYSKDLLRNDESLDRVIGSIRGLAVLKYLAGRVSSPLVNLTALVTSVPASMSGHAGIPVTRAIPLLSKAGMAYKNYKFGDGQSLDNWTLKALELIESRGWDNPQYNHEALDVLKGKLSRKYERLMEYGMLGFSVTERINRVTTILATYQGIREQYKGNWNAIAHDEALKKAKEVSDKAHGVYGKTNLPHWARGGGIAGNVARSYYVFRTFSHNYLLNLKELGFDKKQWGALTYMIASPAVIAGAGASVIAPIIFGALKGLGADDPEEDFYSWIEDLMGQGAAMTARTGVMGLAGAGPALKGSLAIGVLDLPTSISDVFGAPGSVWQDIFYGARSIGQGDIMKGAEQILPTAFGAPIRAYRETTEGMTSQTNTPLFYGNEPLKLNLWEAAMRSLSFNPARVAAIREKQRNEKTTSDRFQDERTKIYARAKKVFLKPVHKRSESDFLDIMERMQKYNAALDADGRYRSIPRMTWRGILNNVKRSMKAPKYERERILKAA